MDRKVLFDYEDEVGNLGSGMSPLFADHGAYRPAQQSSREKFTEMSYRPLAKHEKAATQDGEEEESSAKKRKRGCGEGGGEKSLKSSFRCYVASQSKRLRSRKPRSVFATCHRGLLPPTSFQSRCGG